MKKRKQENPTLPKKAFAKNVSGWLPHALRKNKGGKTTYQNERTKCFKIEPNETCGLNDLTLE